MPKSYTRYPCRWCGKVISVNGRASSSHFRACKVRLAEVAEQQAARERREPDPVLVRILAEMKARDAA